MSYPRPSPPFTRLDIPYRTVRRPMPIAFDAPSPGCGHVVSWTSEVVDEQGSSTTRPDATHDCEEAA